MRGNRGSTAADRARMCISRSKHRWSRMRNEECRMPKCCLNQRSQLCMKLSDLRGLRAKSGFHASKAYFPIDAQLVSNSLIFNGYHARKKRITACSRHAQVQFAHRKIALNHSNHPPQSAYEGFTRHHFVSGPPYAQCSSSQHFLSPRPPLLHSPCQRRQLVYSLSYCKAPSC